MEFKILKVTWRPQNYIDSRIALVNQESLTYEDLRRIVYSDFWGTSDAWGEGLRRLGVDALDIPLRIRQLEIAWWAEFGGGGTTPDSDAVTKAILQHHKPDVLIVEGLESYSASSLARFRDWLPMLRLLIATSGNEVNDPELFRPLDMFLSNRPTLVAAAKAAGIAAHRLSHGFDDRIPALAGPIEKSRDIVFAGLIHPGEKYHERRRRVLEEIARFADIEVYTDSSLALGPSLREYAVKAGAFAVAHAADRLGIPMERLPAPRQMATALSWSRPPELNWSPRLARAARPGLYGLDMFRMLMSARMTINIQPGNADAAATNMRMFEATGSAACLLTDWSEDLGQFFAEDEIVSFKTESEAVSKVRELLATPAEAARIAANGRKRTMRDHTYAKRMEQVAMHIREALANQPLRR